MSHTYIHTHLCKEYHTNSTTEGTQLQTHTSAIHSRTRHTHMQYTRKRFNSENNTRKDTHPTEASSLGAETLDAPRNSSGCLYRGSHNRKKKRGKKKQRSASTATPVTHREGCLCVCVHICVCDSPPGLPPFFIQGSHCAVRTHDTWTSSQCVVGLSRSASDTCQVNIFPRKVRHERQKRSTISEAPKLHNTSFWLGQIKPKNGGTAFDMFHSVLFVLL
jgi:hypothetical protein